MIERRSDWYEDTRLNGGKVEHLIDAACAALNAVTGTPISQEVTDLATALEPFTQAVKEERFFIDKEDDKVWKVVDSERHTYYPIEPSAAEALATLLNELAAKNEQEGEK